MISENVVDDSMENTEVVIGTYENIVLGFKVLKSLRNDGNLYTLETSFTDDAHRGALRCMSVSANGILASSSTDDSVRLHSLRRRKEIGGLFEHNGTVNCLTFFEKSYMFSASDDGNICMWKAKNWEMLKTLKGHKAKVMSVAIHPSGKLALSVGSDKSLLTWDLLTGKLAFQRKIKEVAQHILFTASGDHYILVFQQSIQVCAIEDTQTVKETEMTWRINAVSHIQGDVYAVGGDDRHVFIINVMTGDKLLTLDMAKAGEKDFHGRVRCICTVEDEESSLVFVGTSGGDIKGFSVCVTEDEETSDELLSYEARVRMTCMAVYKPSTPGQTKENESNHLNTNTKVDGTNGSEDEEDGEEEVESAEEEEEVESEEDEEVESEEEEEVESEEEEEVRKLAQTKKRKKKQQQDNLKKKGKKVKKCDGASFSPSPSKERSKSVQSQGVKAKKKKQKLKAK